MSRSRDSVSLKVECVEDRLCLSGGPHANDPLVSVLQNTQGPNAIPALMAQYQQGALLAQSLIQNAAGNNALQHVAIDDQFVQLLGTNGVVTGAEQAIATAASAYGQGGASQGSPLCAAVGQSAFIAGFLTTLAQDYTQNAIADVGQLTSLGSQVVPAIAASIQTLNQVTSDITGNLTGTVGAAGDNFGQLCQHNGLQPAGQFVPPDGGPPGGGHGGNGPHQ